MEKAYDYLHIQDGYSLRHMLGRLKQDEQRVRIRHDIDTGQGVMLAPKWARIEHDMDLQTMYFFRPLYQYAMSDKRYRESVRAVLNLGHIVGLHIDVMPHRMDGDMYVGTKIRQQIDDLRNIAECSIHHTSAHNEVHNFYYGFNYEAWSDLAIHRMETVGAFSKLSTINMGTIGIKRDMSIIQEDHYVTDSMQQWTGVHVSLFTEPIPNENRFLYPKYNSGRERALDAWKFYKTTTLQCLLHPEPMTWRRERI